MGSRVISGIVGASLLALLVALTIQQRQIKELNAKLAAKSKSEHGVIWEWTVEGGPTFYAGEGDAYALKMAETTHGVITVTSEGFVTISLGCLEGFSWMKPGECMPIRKVEVVK